MRRLLNLDETRHTPLLKGPYISLSRAFRQGPPVEQLVNEGILHPHLKNLIPHPTVYGHQEAAFRSIKQGRTTLVSTGTGSGVPITNLPAGISTSSRFTLLPRSSVFVGGRLVRLAYCSMDS